MRSASTRLTLLRLIRAERRYLSRASPEVRVGQHGVFQIHVFKDGALGAYPDHPCALEVRVTEVGASNVGVAQVCLRHFGMDQDGFRQVRSAKKAAAEVSLLQYR